MPKNNYQYLKFIGVSLAIIVNLYSVKIVKALESELKISETNITGKEISLQLQKLEKLSLESETKIETEEFKISQVDQIFVKQIIIEGNTVLNQEVLNEITQPLVGRNVNLSEIQNLAQQITDLYLNEGYILSRAFIPEQDFADGIVKIGVIEGFLEDIIIKGDSRLKTYVKSRVELAAGRPLNYKKLEDGLRLLKEDPLIENIEAVLKEGSQIGQNILEIKITDAKRFFGSAGFDNYSVPSTGDVRFKLDLGYRNLGGLGDNFLLSYRPRVESFDGTYTLDLNYEAPLNPMDGKLKFRVLIERNEIINGDFESLDVRGDSEYYELSYRQPIIRELNEELALSFGFAHREGQTFTFAGPTPFGFGPDEKGITKTDVLIFGQEYSLREPSGAWGFRSQFRVGVGIFNPTSNPDPIPDGYFFAWLGQIQRLQVIDDNNLLIIQLDAQLTPDSLLPSEQFTIGGGQSVRGYRQNALTADNGIRFSLEDRISLVKDEGGKPLFQLAPFMDMGGVWNSSDNPNSLVENQTFIIGIGLGALWQPIDGLLVRLDYAPPIIDLDTRMDNIQDDGFYFNINYEF